MDHRGKEIKKPKVRKAKEFSHRELEELIGKYKPTMGRSGGILKQNRKEVIQ